MFALNFSQHSQRTKLSHETPGSLWEPVGNDIFSINNKHYLCIVDYHSKFSVIKHIEGVSADKPIKHVKLFLQSMGCTAK